MASRLYRPLVVSVLVGLTALVGPGALVGRMTPARAAEGDAGIAVLGIEALDAQDNAVANDTTEAGASQLQGKDLVEIKLIFSCPDEATACLAQAGKSLGASQLLFGNIKR